MSFLKNFGNPTGKIGKMIVSSMNKGHTPISEWGLKHYTFHNDTNALDIGCGGGMNVYRMLQACPEGYVCGIDISDESINKTKEINAEYIGKRCDIKKGNAADIPFENHQFDLVTAFETLYFWQNIPQCFAEVKRVLKPGGTFMVVNEITNPKSIWNKLVDGMDVPAIDTIQQYFVDAGFTDLQIDRKGEWVTVMGKIQ